jgi:hypothetical protein
MRARETVGVENPDAIAISSKVTDISKSLGQKNVQQKTFSMSRFRVVIKWAAGFVRTYPVETIHTQQRCDQGITTMLRFFVMLGSAVLAVGAGTLVIESGLLGASATTELGFLQAIHRALLAIGILLLALFGALMVIALPDQPRELNL